MTSFKLKKIVVVILLLVIFGEMGFYAYVQLQKNAGKKETGILTKEKTNISTSSAQQKKLILPETIKYLKSDLIPSLEKIPKSNNRKLYLIQETSGFVGEYRRNDRNQGYELKIVDQQNNQIITYFISKKNMDKKRAYRWSQGKKTPISLQDIKMGTKIIITIREDLVNPENSYDEYLVIE